VARAGNLIGGRYRLVEQIGHGSMGAVWKAVHETLGRPFAVKFLKQYGVEDDGERAQERFLREARLAAAVSHRFVVGVLDFGMTDEATPYIVMEYLHGESLGARLRRSPAMGVRELARLMAQTLLGLEAVHQAGVVHRDMKPDNVILVPEAGGVIAKVVDFSISRPEPGVARGGQGRPTTLTIPGTTVGTPWYMSPEQASGIGPIDRRSDIYSVGVMLYECLAGDVPYDGPDIDAVLLAVARADAPPIRDRHPEFGAALSEVIARAMRLAPDQRFDSAARMAEALFAALDDIPESLTLPARDELFPFGRPSTVTMGPSGPPPAALAATAAAPVAAAASVSVSGPVAFGPRAGSTTALRRRQRTRGATAALALAAAALVVILAAYRFNTRAGEGGGLQANEARAAGATAAALTGSRTPVPPAPETAVVAPWASPALAAEPRPVKARAAPTRAARRSPPIVFRDPGF
jgi:eukaryotic-like serine/threonine-protein kinase